DDEQHEHHVDHRGDVDLAHHLATTAAAVPSQLRCGGVSGHQLFPSRMIWSENRFPLFGIMRPYPPPRSSICRDRIAENSSAKPSRRWACLFTSAANLL